MGQRTACPNDCSGHGTCEYIQNLGYGAVEFDYSHSEFTQELLTFDYYGWDKEKTRGCVCDPEWGDVDCSKRLCPYGNDMMDKRDDLTNPVVYQKQTITLNPTSATLSNLDGSSFALTFTSKINETFTTIPINIDTSSMSSLATAVGTALKKLPNGVVDDVDVEADDSGNKITIDVTFTGSYVQGPQHLLTVVDFKCDAGCFPKISGLDLAEDNGDVVVSVDPDYNSYECGRRGKCDYDTVFVNALKVSRDQVVAHVPLSFNKIEGQFESYYSVKLFRLRNYQTLTNYVKTKIH